MYSLHYHTLFRRSGVSWQETGVATDVLANVFSSARTKANSAQHTTHRERPRTQPVAVKRTHSFSRGSRTSAVAPCLGLADAKLCSVLATTGVSVPPPRDHTTWHDRVIQPNLKNACMCAAEVHSNSMDFLPRTYIYKMALRTKTLDP